MDRIATLLEYFFLKKWTLSHVEELIDRIDSNNITKDEIRSERMFLTSNIQSHFDSDVFHGGAAEDGYLSIDRLRRIKANASTLIDELRRVMKEEIFNIARNRRELRIEETLYHTYPEGGVTEYDVIIYQEQRIIEITSVLSKSSRDANEDGNAIRFESVMEYEIS
jgi:hypothetical protein